MNTKLKRFFSLIGLILLCQGVGILGAISTTQNLAGWYSQLTKPFFNPPSWIFGPVWTILYLMMAVSCWLVLCDQNHKELKFKALLLFGLQLIANALWSFLFFGMQNPFYGLVDILLLGVLIFLTLKSFRVISKSAAYLLMPYFVWVCFATLLNISLWWLNR